MYKLMNSDRFVGPVNVGNPEEHSIKDLARLVIKLTKSKSKLTYKDLPKDDPMQRKPDISLANEKLNWEPKIKVNTGLRKTIKYFKSVI